MPLDLTRIRAALPGRDIHYLESTTTTMGEAAKLAAHGAPAGTLILAERQTAGRGRLGRAWYSEAGAGVYLTLIGHPRETVPLLTVATGLAVHRVVTVAAKEAGLADAVDLRWPNDVLIHGRKCAGILLTTDGEALLSGVGLNVNHQEFPDDLAEIATSLRRETGRQHDREAIIIQLVHEIEQEQQSPPEEIRKRFAEISTYANGRPVELEDTGQQGTTAGLDADGFLLLRLADGRIERVVTGGVRPANPARPVLL